MSWLEQAIKKFLNACCGFFIIEDSILKSGTILFVRSEVEQLWEHAVSRVKLALSQAFSYLREHASMIALKDEAVLLSRTMETYQFPTKNLISFVLEYRPKFEDLLISAVGKEINKAFAEDKYEPLTLLSEKDYEKQVTAFSLQHGLSSYQFEDEKSEMSSKLSSASVSISSPQSRDSSGRLVFPVTVPFSVFLPKLCRIIKHAIKDYYSFGRNLASIDNHVCQVRKQNWFLLIALQAIDNILIEFVNKAFCKVLDDGKSFHISQAVQLSINSDFLVSACDYFQNLMISFSSTKTSEQDESIIRLQSRKQFVRTRERFEYVIFELVNSKIEEFLTSLRGNINW